MTKPFSKPFRVRWSDMAFNYNGRGVAYWRNRQFKRAEDDFAKALQLDPNHPHAKNNLDDLGRRALSW